MYILKNKYIYTLKYKCIYIVRGRERKELYVYLYNGKEFYIMENSFPL